MACVFGRARAAGQIVWAARFKEKRRERSAGKGGPKTVEYAYSLSFAVAVGEGPIDGIGRVWADGKPMDMTGLVMRVHRGGPEQTPDPLIEAVEGSAPAYRGTAYVVFEDLPLAAYGNRPPQLSFEVFRRPVAPGAGPALEDRLEGVCLMPGAGEFVYATGTVLRRESLIRTRAENVTNTEGRPDLLVSLDQLQAQLPKVKRVTLVVSWFGDDLRCGACTVRPGVERTEKPTLPDDWRAGGVGRGGARLISQIDGAPSYGGTPSDASVVQAIAELKARGFEVTLLPFLMMDVPPGNGLPDPYGGAEQAAFPWRGRITGEAEDVAAFFGTAGPEDFAAAGGTVSYSGPAEWSWRRMVLHYARLATLAGGVDGFLIGSELRGLTWVRDGARAHPAVVALKSLAADCRAVLGSGTRISYAADWSEWFRFRPWGSGEVVFHLDPLWADPNVAFVGIDWYPPLADQRPGEELDPEALAENVAGGEGFDWFYASDADRAAGTRTPIVDGAHGEDCVFRTKDLASWWSNAHHDRPGGVRASEPTAWVPKSKPIRFVEFGCPAVDRGANAPNLFIDPKSAESALPPFSSGSRDDLAQRRTLEAVLGWFAAPANNPVSPVYGGPMLEAADAWCWDARPFPDFPARSDVWADATNWETGHWLNGRTGVAPAPDLIGALLARGGLGEGDVDLSGLSGAVTGYVVDRPMRLADGISPLLEAFAVDPVERGGKIAFAPRRGPAAVTLGPDDLALPEEGAQAVRTRRLEPAPDLVRVRFSDERADYQTGSVAVRRDPASGGGALDLELPAVVGAPLAERIARRVSARLSDAREERALRLGPLAGLRLQPGDVAEVEGEPGAWRITRVDLDEQPRALAVVVDPPDAGFAGEGGWRPGEAGAPAGPPVLLVLDLPPLPGAEEDRRPLVAVAAEPWRELDVHAGSSAAALSLRARAAEPAVVGVLKTSLSAGPTGRLDRAARLEVEIEGAELESRGWAEVAAGANALAVLGAGGEWEVLQFLSAELVGAERWRLSGLLRGQAGTDSAALTGAEAGAPVVLLTPSLPRAEVRSGERAAPLVWRAAPAGAPPGGLGSTEIEAAWNGLWWRPWGPVRLKARRLANGDLRLSWTRRGRLGGDSWEGEVPLSEEREAYRVEVMSGGAVVRAWEVAGTEAVYAAADQAADFPGGTPVPVTVRVSQGSVVWGWGVPAQRSLWH